MTARRVVTNPFASPEAVVSTADTGAVVPRTFHQSLPGYAPTPLRVLGFMATGFFPLTGGIQILLLPILPDALTVV